MHMIIYRGLDPSLLEDDKGMGRGQNSPPNIGANPQGASWATHNPQRRKSLILGTQQRGCRAPGRSIYSAVLAKFELPDGVGNTTHHASKLVPCMMHDALRSKKLKCWFLWHDSAQ